MPGVAEIYIKAGALTMPRLQEHGTNKLRTKELGVTKLGKRDDTFKQDAQRTTTIRHWDSGCRTTSPPARPRRMRRPRRPW